MTARTFLSALGAAVCLIVSAAHAAGAADDVGFAASPRGDHARIALTFPPALATADLVTSAEVVNSVLVIGFARPVEGDLDALVEGLGDLAARARLDADGRALRIALRRPSEARLSRSYEYVAVDLVPEGSSVTPAPIASPRAEAEARAAEEARRRAEAEAELAARGPPVLPLNIRSAEAAEYTRIVFDWTEPVGYRLETEPGRARVVFDRDAAPSLTQLRIAPPRGVTGVSETREDRRLALTFDLDAGLTPRIWADGSNVVLDLALPSSETSAALEALAAQAEARERAAAPPPQPPAVVEVASPERPDPTPESGAVRAETTPIGAAVQVRFAWANPVGAAAFRRGDAIWIAFDADAEIDIGELRRGGGRHVRDAAAFSGEDYAAVRILAPAATQVSAAQDGASWTFLLSERAEAAPRPIPLSTRAEAGAPAQLFADLDGHVSVRALPDPAAGDVISVVTLDGPARGAPGRRSFTGFAVLPSAHGLAVESTLDDLAVAVTAKGVQIGRPQGLALTRPNAGGPGAAQTALPGFIDFEGWGGPPGAFVAQHDRLAREAAAADAPSDARLTLGRFLTAHGLAAEALGVLRVIEAEDPEFARAPAFRALRGANNYLMGRVAPAERDFATPQLALDPAAALWRGLLAADAKDWREARRQLEAGDDARFLFQSAWRGRFLLADAEAALALNDLAGARAGLDQARAEALDRTGRTRADLLEARYLAAIGETGRAIEAARAVAASGYEPIEAAALHLIVTLERDAGTITNEAALDQLEALRFRWRGDATEIDIATEVGRLYIAGGEVRRGLALLRAVTKRFPESAPARQVGIEMMDIFADLYLEGGADRLDPIQALALWYEFQDLTPIGADGDRMIRRLADRLVDFDLLEPAAELLSHQVENRLRGAPKAYVAADLATIYLEDRRPEDALRVLQESRFAGLPAALTGERRLLEARALAELGRADHAFELLAHDRSRPAARMKADMAWAARDWPRAGLLFEAAIAVRDTGAGPLPASDEAVVLRAAVAYGLAGDQPRLDRLVERYGAAMRAGGQAATWAVLTENPTIDSTTRLRDLARGIAAADTLDAFLEDVRASRERPTEDAPAPEGPDAATDDAPAPA